MKTQIVLPDELAIALKRTVPIRQRSRFIAEAVEGKLRALRFQQALNTAAGSWTDKHHAALNSQAAINRYLARFRKRFHSRGAIPA